MPYFNNFPQTSYKFGNENYEVSFPNLTVYSEILDEIKSSGVFYTEYYIKQGTRPDQVSYELYDNPKHHWTFYLLNDKIREQGWPLDYDNLQVKIKENFPNTTIVTRNEIYDKFLVGKTFTGLTSETTATVIKRNLDLGQIVVSGTKTFTDGELLVDEDDNTITLNSATPEKDSIIFYRDANKEIIDIDPFTGPSEGATGVTHSEYFDEQTTEMRHIIVLKPEVLERVVNEFRRVVTQ